MLFLVLFLRIAFTLMEEKLGTARFGPRKRTVTKLVDFLMREGEPKLRMMCYMCSLAQLFILPSELAYYGLELSKMVDDDTS